MSDRRPGTPADVDWEGMRAMYERGMSMGEIARRNGVTRQAVGYRVKNEGWKVAEDVQEERKTAVAARWLERLAQTDLSRAAAPENLSDIDPTVPAVLYGRTFHPKAAASILASIAEGDGEKVAVSLSGVEATTWNAWLKVDKGFEALVMAARAQAARKLRGKIMSAADFDWKAAQYLLEKTEETAGFVKQPEAVENRGITVNISLARDEKVALSLGVKEPELIDVTPEPPPRP